MNELNLRSKCENAKKGMDNDGTDAFVGIEYKDNDVCIYFPIGFEIPEEDDKCRLSIISLLETISKANKIKKEGFYLTDHIEDDNSFPLLSYIWLINDYLSNGLYQPLEKIIKKNLNGKVNWKRTFKEVPFLNCSNLVYLNLYTEHNYFSESIITQIHIFCLNIAFKRIGFLFGNFKEINSIISWDDKEFCKKVLRDELAKTFDDRKQQLLINLLKVFIGSETDDKRDINKYGTNDFKWIWQIVIKYLFGNEEITKYDINAIYVSDRIFDQKSKKSKLEMDALLFKNDEFYIIDAKYYQFGVEMIWNSAPNTTDVEKQVVYGEYVDLFYKGKYDVFNSFIIPYNKNNNASDNKFNKDIEYVGYSKVTWKDYSVGVKPYFYVAVILVDCKFAIESWVHNRTVSTKDDLVEAIKEISNSLEKCGDPPIAFVQKN